MGMDIGNDCRIKCEKATVTALGRRKRMMTAVDEDAEEPAETDDAGDRRGYGKSRRKGKYLC